MVSRDPSKVWIAVYMMATRKHGTVYIGVTSELIGRIAQHRDETFKGFTSKYGLKRLVWFETHSTMASAIQREKSLKKYKREWKTNLIEHDNLDWNDLFPDLLEKTDYDRWPELRPKG
ncbi:MAG TPA: GIY-YIG nuclease family protein [Brevundimonas sp.]